MNLMSGKKLTEVEQKIIDYMWQNPEKIIGMTIHDLAEACYSSNTVIVRLCKKFGYNGYRDFKFAFIQEIESEKYMQRNVDFSVPFSCDADPTEIIRSMFDLFQNNIAVLNAQIDRSCLMKAAGLLFGAKRIFCYALGDSLLTMQSFASRLQKIGIYPVLATLNGDEIAASCNVSADDCAIFLSYSGFYGTFVPCLRILKNNKVKIIAITSNQSSMIVQNSDCTILIPDQEKESNVGTFYSQLSFQYVLNILYSLVYAQNYSKNEQRKESIAHLNSQQRKKLQNLVKPIQK